MSRPTIILITGMPASGKTTLGTMLSEKYHLPFISKDALKERMFNELGSKDKEWSLKVSAASHRIMDYIIDEQLKIGQSIILESNFKQKIDSERFAAIQDKYVCELVQILCWAEGEVLFERFRSRIGTISRHQGHVEIPLQDIHDDFVTNNGKDKPLIINGRTVELDTTSLKDIDYVHVYEVVEKALNL